MFKRIAQQLPSEKVTLLVEGRVLNANAGESLAIALMGSGMKTFRTTPVTGEERGPFCMMGVCFECLVEVNGRQNVQSCMVEVSEGMQVRMQHGARKLEPAA